MAVGDVQKWSIDSHWLEFEPPDLAHIIWNGSISADHAQRMVELLTEITRPKFCVLLDLTNAGIPSLRERAVMQKSKIHERFTATAVISTNYTKRTVMSMLVRAAKRLDVVAGEVAFFENEEAARAWLATMRA